MKIQIVRVWEDLSQSFWFTPMVMATGGLVLAIGLVLVEPLIRPHHLPFLSELYLADPLGARSILETIASSAITVAGVVFSITIVVLNMASAQFGPRLLPNFMQDGSTQIVLGTYVGTFIYCLTVLSLIHVGDQETSVPQLAVAAGLALGVLSFAVLIYFIHHVAIFIQAPRIVNDVARQLEKTLKDAFPPRRAELPDGAADPLAQAPKSPLIDGRPVRATSAGYVQATDQKRLLSMAREHDLRLRLLVHPGDYVSEGDIVARVSGEVDEERPTEEAVLAKIVLGPQRTQTQDPAFGVYQLVEIALRALSPGINDPFTAISCIDRIGNCLGVLALREIPSELVWDDQDTLRLQVKPYTYRSIVAAAFDQLRRTAAAHLDVTLRLLHVIASLLQRDLPPTLREALIDQARAIRAGTSDLKLAQRDRESLDRALTEALAQADEEPAGDGQEPGEKRAAGE